jgi:hypothetical protein
MLGPYRRPVEREQATALEDAVDDGGGQVVVVEHSAPVDVQVVADRGARTEGTGWEASASA